MIAFFTRTSVIAIMLMLLPGKTWAAVVDGNVIMDQRMSENLCALTFDDGPSVNTPELLDMLAAYKIPATFFLLGQQAERYPRLVRRIGDEGHEIGNHSWSHPNLRKMSREDQENEILATDSLLRSFGVTPLYLRPPYGAFDDNTINIAKELGISIILWSLDSRDWKKLPDNYAKLRSTRGTIYDDGALRGIFLFHDTHRSTVADLPRIITNLRAGGCEKFVTVSDYLAGILDPEPPLRLTRHEIGHQAVFAASSNEQAAERDAANIGNINLARCSKPWEMRMNKEKLAPASFDDAHAAAPSNTGGL